ncbi:MAG: sulfatase [Proteobacteria bacterium]|nr:sulfatase [Pseudomonadota bacterium]
MSSRLIISLAAVASLSACGKSSPTATTTEKVAEGATTSTTPSKPADGKPADGKPAVAQPGKETPEVAKPATPPTKAEARGPERAVYSLIDNRLSAHLARGGGLLLDGGSAGFAKYLRFGNTMNGGIKRAWELRQTHDDVKVARLTGKNGTMFVPVSAAQAGKSTLRLRAFSEKEGALSLRVNGAKDINGKLGAGWSTLELTIPAGQLKEGENSLQWFMKAPGVEVAWMQLGATTPGVLATAEDGATVEGKLTGTGSAVDLSALAGKAARLDLEGAGCETSMVSNANLVVPGELPAVKRGEGPKYVVFVIMDSLRADRVKAFNSKARPEAPNWSQLAESSTLFMNNYVQGNESQVSHASMWTSNYLVKHRAAQMSDKLADKWVTIDEVAKKAGKMTAGASANGYIRPSRGFGSSWDTGKYVNHIEKSLGLRGGDVLEQGLSFVQSKSPTPQPWFLYLGMIDTHVTWRAKQPWLDKYDGGYKGRFATSFGDDGPGGIPKDLTDKEKEHVRALYDSNVSYQDELLGKLVEKLTAWGIYDQTMIIVTADHGDEQWEDGRVGHGGSQRETLLHVPLMIHYPPMFPAVKIKEGTEGIDIVPTLADALGVAVDPEWQGQSLLPVANGQGGYLTMSTSSKYENGHAGRIGHWKVNLVGTGDPRVFDLSKDAGEHKDLWGSQAAAIGTRLVMDPLWILRQWNVEWKKAQWGNAADVSGRFAADLGE